MVNGYPELWGDYLCLDLINSLEREYSGTGRMIDWLPKAGWRAAVLELWRLELDDPDEPVPMAAVVEFRARVRAMLEAWVRGGKVDATGVQFLRTLIELAPITRDVVQGPQGYVVEVRPLTRNWSWVLAEAAVSAFELMADGDKKLLKKCGNPDCTWLFYDDSLNHSRRWCSSRACGNLLKVRRFRALRK